MDDEALDAWERKRRRCRKRVRSSARQGKQAVSKNGTYRCSSGRRLLLEAWACRVVSIALSKE